MRSTMTSKFDDKCGRCGEALPAGSVITFGRPAGAMHPAKDCRASEFYAGKAKALPALSEEARKALRREQKAQRQPVVVETKASTKRTKATKAPTITEKLAAAGITKAELLALLAD